MMAPQRPKITRESLLTLEAYAKAREDFRARVLEHKRARTVHLGEHLTLVFEDELTLRILEAHGSVVFQNSTCHAGRKLHIPEER